MWNRNSTDPLAQLFFNKYGMHLLKQPRQDVSVGDVYPRQNHSVAPPGRLQQFIEPPPELPDIRLGEKVADIADTNSNTVTGKLSFGFFENFLAALGAATLVEKFKATFSSKHAAGLQLRFSQASRDYVDPFAMERKLRKHRFDYEDSLFKKGYRYYIVLGVLRTNALSITATDENDQQLDLGIEAADIVDAQAKVAINVSNNKEVTVDGDKALAFGVQLSELCYNEKKQRLELEMVKNYIQVMSEGEEFPGYLYASISGEEDDLFLPETEV